MICIHCHQADTRVIESRDVADGETIRRRRECSHCQQRFTTYERVERPQLIVIKKDGNRELFDRDKLLAGLYRACEKTPVTSVQIERLVADVEQQLYNCGESELPSSKIGQMIMDGLAKLNEVAYVRFASVYRRFTDLSSFEKELLQIRSKGKGQKAKRGEEETLPARG